MEMKVINFILKKYLKKGRGEELQNKKVREGALSTFSKKKNYAYCKSKTYLTVKSVKLVLFFFFFLL